MIVITGPTASGKTSAGIMVAEALGGEIVSADSMQIYRGLDIGTASPTPEERARVAHHLIDIRYPWESYDAAAFVRDAQLAARDIERRGKVAVVVGGTALYLKALLEGLFDGPPANAEVRDRLRAIAAREGSARLHEMLSEVDPDASARLHPNDEVRLVRALEVFECTGRPISEQQRQFGQRRDGLDAAVVCLARSRGDLDERIDSRVDAMFASGLVAETRRAVAHPAGLGRTPGQALGYKQVINHLAGRCGFVDCVRSVKQATRRFARKQMNWFRHFSGMETLDIGHREPAEAICDRLLAFAGL